MGIIVVSLTCTANQYGTLPAEYRNTVQECDANEDEQRNIVGLKKISAKSRFIGIK
jgi:hypothetical protein